MVPMVSNGPILYLNTSAKENYGRGEDYQYKIEVLKYL